VTGADIDIQDDGTVFIGSREGAGADQAAKMIDEIANPRPLSVGERFTGKVVKIATFGAFVNLVPGRDGLVHISKLGRGRRLSSVEESGLKEGDTLEVEIQEIDAMGKISLKPIGEEWAVPEGMEVLEPPRRERRDGDRGPGERGRGDRGRAGRRPRERDRERRGEQTH
ncbi:MAG TPA: S1 RNA-binding domain-containing protein, partial [Actinomycetota bacterium]|nr:S1 RNA-binding domain-containing protein [Actinomycetota bacterium]